MAGLVPATHALLSGTKDVGARHNRAFTPVFAGYGRGMTTERLCVNPTGISPSAAPAR
jgi:hypothetical protein